MYILIEIKQMTNTVTLISEGKYQNYCLHSIRCFFSMFSIPANVF